LNIYDDVISDEMEQANAKITGLALSVDFKMIPAASAAGDTT